MIAKVREALKNIETRYVMHAPDGIPCDPRLVTEVDSQSFLAEQYRAVAQKLATLGSEDAPIKSVMLTSCQPEEGKTTTATNLAISLAKDFQLKTVIVDADLRRPEVHRLIKVEREAGVVDILTGEAKLESCIREVSGIENFHLISAGSSHENATSLLSSSGMREMILELRSSFDRVIIDVPPVLKVADPSILGGLCDAVLFVVRARSTPTRAIKEAFQALEGTPAMPKAFILTHSETRPDYYSYITNKHYRRYFHGRGNSKY